MPRQKRVFTTDRDILIAQEVLDVQLGKYKLLYKAEKHLQLPKSSVMRRANGMLSRPQARQQQQKLLYTKEKVLLKWIKELTISGYSLGH